jgi:pyruvate kinase
MKKDIAAKIIATLGPASSSKSLIRKLISAGVDIFRLNLSHGDFDSHSKLIKNIRRAADELDTAAGIMADLPGPKIRIGQLEDGPLTLKRRDTIILKSAATTKGGDFIPVDFRDIHKMAKKGTEIFINDGAVKLLVKSISEKAVECRVKVGGEVGSRKGINIPGGKFPSRALTRHDKDCVKFGIENKVDFIALSFVRKGSDLKTLRRLIKREGGSQFLIAKIEKPEAIDEFDNILDETDGVMIARGDLGIEIPIEKVPIVQKDLLSRCNSAGVPVITATQVLESMVKNPRPTRAEAADAANAILDKTDALMLSQETAIGKYPVESVRTLRDIVYETEKILKTGGYNIDDDSLEIADCVARSVVETARDLKIKVIVAPTRSGRTARLIARYRPRAKVLALSDNDKTGKDLMLSWGIESIQMDHGLELAKLIKRVRDLLLKKKYSRIGDKFIITSGSPISDAGETNLMVVETV